MKLKSNHLWLLAGIIWLAALIMTYGNHDQIDAVSAMREKNEQLRKEMLFQRRNDKLLNRIQEAHASHYMPVASVKLGFETVRSQLHALAMQLGLKDLKIECQTSQIMDTQLPLHLQMMGDIEMARGFILALHAFPHLAVRHASITVLAQKTEAEIEMELNYQFKIDPAGKTGIHRLQAAAAYPPSLSAGP